MSEQAVDVPIEHLLRELTPQVLGTVVRRFRDFAAAEDAFQEASLAAAMQWPREGPPDNPRAWLTQVAFRRMADHIRSESARRRREGEVADVALVAAHTPESTAIETAPQEDDTLVLLFWSSVGKAAPPRSCWRKSPRDSVCRWQRYSTIRVHLPTRCPSVMIGRRARSAVRLRTAQYFSCQLSLPFRSSRSLPASARVAYETGARGREYSSADLGAGGEYRDDAR